MIQRLEAWLEQQNMTKRELSRRLGVTEDYIYMVTNGKRPITPSFIGRFAQAFGFDVAEQLFGDGNGEYAKAEPQKETA